MRQSNQRSLVAIIGGLLAVVFANMLAPPLAVLAWGWLPGSYLHTHGLMVGQWTMVSVIVFTALAGGVTVGVLAPSRPALHALVVAVVSAVIGLLLIGVHGLPRGDQLTSYVLQMVLLVATAQLCFPRRRRKSTGPLMPERIVQGQ